MLEASAPQGSARRRCIRLVRQALSYLRPRRVWQALEVFMDSVPARSLNPTYDQWIREREPSAARSQCPTSLGLRVRVSADDQPPGRPPAGEYDPPAGHGRSRVLTNLSKLGDLPRISIDSEVRRGCGPRFLGARGLQSTANRRRGLRRLRGVLPPGGSPTRHRRVRRCARPRGRLGPARTLRISRFWSTDPDTDVVYTMRTASPRARPAAACRR